MDIKEQLNNLGLKATPQRLSLIALLKEHGHMTIDAMYEILKDESASLSLSTVYNNLSALRDKGIVREVAVAGSKQFFELERFDHAHFICKDCGAIIDMPIVKSNAKKLVDFPDGVVVDDVDLIFTGTCTNCAKAQMQARSKLALA